MVRDLIENGKDFLDIPSLGMRQTPSRELLRQWTQKGERIPTGIRDRQLLTRI
jgi:hypothetical protein